MIDLFKCLIAKFRKMGKNKVKNLYREEKYTSLGLYNPSFFKITLKTGEELPKEDSENPLVSEITGAAFLHEYIHFLQDITTSSGLNNFCYIVDYIKWINYLYRTEDVLYPPYHPSSSEMPYLKENALFRDAYSGSKKQISPFFKIESVKLVNEKICDGFEDNLLMIECMTQNATTQSYDIGEYAISECMAYNIDSHVFPDVLPAPPVFPYNIVNVIADRYCEGLGNDKLKIIAVCDACLMFDNPGYILYISLTSEQTNEYIKMSAEDIFDYINNLGAKLYGRKSIDILEEKHNGALQQWNDLFSPDKNFDKIRNYISDTLKKAYTFRKNDPHFIIEAVRESEKKQLSQFIKIIERLGAPLILNEKKDKIVQITPSDEEIETYYLWVLEQIYKLFTGASKFDNGVYKCEMYEFCKSSFEYKKMEDALSIISSDFSCIYNPWERRKTKEERCICPFGAYWYSCAMKDVSEKNSYKSSFL